MSDCWLEWAHWGLWIDRQKSLILCGKLFSIENTYRQWSHYFVVTTYFIRIPGLLSELCYLPEIADRLVNCSFTRNTFTASNQFFLTFSFSAFRHFPLAEPFSAERFSVFFGFHNTKRVDTKTLRKKKLMVLSCVVFVAF